MVSCMCDVVEMESKNQEECEKYNAETLEIIWKDQCWHVLAFCDGVNVMEEDVKIITIKNGELATTSHEVFIEFEKITLSAPNEKKYVLCGVMKK